MTEYKRVGPIELTGFSQERAYELRCSTDLIALETAQKISREIGFALNAQQMAKVQVAVTEAILIWSAERAYNLDKGNVVY